jgi:hypothetical protein
MSRIPETARSAAAAGSQSDYGTLFLNEHLSDLVIIVEEDLATEDEVAQDTEEPPSKRPRVSSDSGGHVRCALLTTACQGTGIKLLLSAASCGSTEQHTTRLPGHKVVLWGRSQFFRSKVRSTYPAKACNMSNGIATAALLVKSRMSLCFLFFIPRMGGGRTGGLCASVHVTHDLSLLMQLDNWMDPSKAPEVELAVPAGQFDVAYLLLKGMYHPQLDLSTCSSDQLSQLVQLAARYQVSHMVGAASLALNDKITASQDFTAVVAVYQLPESTLKLPECGAAAAAAQSFLVTKLGDLEVSWNDKQKKEQLLGLPFQGLKQLLQHQETKVASEDTVLYTIHKWLDRQQQQGGRASQQEQHDLAQTIRVAHCSPLCVVKVMPCCPWLVEAWGVQDLMAASALSCKPKQQAPNFVVGDSDLMSRRSSWSLGPRPASAIKQGQLTWAIPLDYVKAFHAEARVTGEDEGSSSDVEGMDLVWCGMEFELSLYFSPSDGLGVFLHTRMPCIKAGSDPIATVRCLLAFIDTHKKPYSVPYNDTEESAFKARSAGRGYFGCCFCEGSDSWAEVEQKLRAASVVHGDGSVQVHVCLKSVE